MRRLNSSSITAMAATVLLAVTACTPSPDDYSSFHTLPGNGWAYSHRLSFISEIADSAATGSMTVAVRHSAAFDYRNLWLEVAQTMPDSTVRRDTVNIELADKFGTWLGSGLGTSFQRAVTLPRPFTLADSSTVTVRHIMRVDTLTGIEQIGIIFKSDRQQPSCNN